MDGRHPGLVIGMCRVCGRSIDTNLWGGMCKGCFDLVWGDPHPATALNAVSH